MIESFSLVKRKRLDNLYMLSQNTHYFEHEITTFVQPFSKLSFNV